MLSAVREKWSVFWSSAAPVVQSAIWWRQQIWVVLTEIIMGFLAVLGFARGLDLHDIALGLALAYGLSWAGLIPLVRGTRIHAIILGLLAGVAALCSALPGPAGWWALAAAGGLLLAFRDAQSIQSFLWVPIRAMRANGTTFGSMNAGQGLAIVHTGAWIVASAWLMQHTTWWASAVLMLALVVGVPDMIRQRPTTRPRVERVHRVHKRHTPELYWLTRLSAWFNAMHFLGRRLVMPAAMVALAHHAGWGDKSIVLIGGALSLVAVAGAVVRSTLPKDPALPSATMIKGLEWSLAGWLVMAVGAALVAWWPGWTAAGLILVGWIVMEVAIRLWGVGYMETLRTCAIARAPRRRARAHREALSHFMRHKNAAATAGLIVAGLATPLAGPALIGGMGVACWRVLQKGRHHVERSKSPDPT